MKTSNGFKGEGRRGQPPPYWVRFFCNKPPLPIWLAYISLCTFAINDDGTDTLSSASFSKIFWSATGEDQTECGTCPFPCGTLFPSEQLPRRQIFGEKLSGKCVCEAMFGSQKISDSTEKRRFGFCQWTTVNAIPNTVVEFVQGYSFIA